MTSSPAIRAGACALAGAAAAAAMLLPTGAAAGATAPAVRACPGRIAQILTEITVSKVTCAQGKAPVRRWIRLADFGADSSKGEVLPAAGAGGPLALRLARAPRLAQPLR